MERRGSLAETLVEMLVGNDLVDSYVGYQT